MPALIKGKQIAADTITGTNIDETGTISTIDAGDSAVGGTSTGIARRDHQHAVSTGGSTSTIQPDDSAAEGTSSNLAREDHQHAIVAAAPSQGIGGSNAEGSSTSFARADHDHTIRETNGPTDLTVGAITTGQLVERSGTALVGITAIDDTQHGSRSGGTLHSVATTGTAGFMSATDKAKLDSLQDAAGIDAKESVRLCTTGNHGLSGLSDIDGVTPSAGDRILVWQQTTGSEDGIYEADSSTWSRTDDAPTSSEARGWIVHVEEGSTYGDQLWQCTNNEGSDVVGTDDLTFAQIGAGSPRGAGAGLVLNGNDLDVGANGDGSITVNADDIQVGTLASDSQHGTRGGGTQHSAATTSVNGFMSSTDKSKLDGIATGATATTPQQESVTTQAITGTDTALSDTLNNTPYSNASVSLFLNGVQQQQGAGKDYTISGSTITWLANSGTAVDMETTDTLEAYYMS